MALRHPWVASVLGQVGLAYLGPNVMRMSDRLLALFESAGFALEEADQAMSTVIAYVVGVATSEAAYLSMIARSGKDEREWMEGLSSTVEQAVQEYPRLKDGHASQGGKDPAKVREGNFVYAWTVSSTAWRLGSACPDWGFCPELAGFVVRSRSGSATP